MRGGGGGSVVRILHCVEAKLASNRTIIIMVLAFCLQCSFIYV